jgi:hypothetical protein
MDPVWEQIERAVEELHDLNGKVLELNELLRVTALDFRDTHAGLDRLCQALPASTQSGAQASVRAYIDQYLRAGKRLIGEFEAAGLYDPLPLMLVPSHDTTRRQAT